MKSFVKNDIISRFDTSHKFWDKFNVRDKSLEKKLGYFEVKSINNLCQIVVAVNPKDYYEHFENFNHNKKPKGQKEKRTAGMNFENFATRIAGSNQIGNFDVPKNEYEEQQTASREMHKHP